MKQMDKNTLPIQNTPWMAVEDVGCKISMVRNALLIGSWALNDHDGCIGGCAEEMGDYFSILREFLEKLETNCDDISTQLVNEKKKEGAA